MKKMFGAARRLLSVLLILSMLAAYVPGVVSSAAAVTTDSATVTKDYTSLADPNTSDSHSMLGTSVDGNRYAGRIWVDKSVFTGSTSVSLGDTGIAAIPYEDEFMVVYSALGSTTSVTSTTTVGGALDVVIILDNSASMGNYTTDPDDPGNSTYTRLESVVAATNELLETLVNMGDVRVGLVTYSTDSEVLLPLDYYRDETDDTYLTVSIRSRPSSQGGNVAVSAGDGRMSATAVNGSGETVSNSNSGYQMGTNLQSGINTGMGLLANADDTANRTPVVIVMTDGVADRAVTKDWDNVASGNTAHPFSNTITGGVALSTLLNAAYMTAKVEDNYNNTNPVIYGVGVDLGESSDAFVVMNPSSYFTASAGSTSVAGKAYTWYTQWLEAAGDLTIRDTHTADDNGRQSTKTTQWTYNQLSSADSVTKADVQANINYVDTYYNVSSADSAQDSLKEAFQEIVNSLESPTFSPITDTVTIGGTDHHTPLTYVDFIGEYMAVQAIKAVTLFGQTLSVSAGATTNSDVTENGVTTRTSTTKFVVESKTLTNAVLGLSFDTAEAVTMELISTCTIDPVTGDRTSVADQALWVYVQEEALPLLSSTIVDKDGVITYTSTEADPLRVYYTVGLSGDVLAADGTLMITRISADYLAKHTNSDGTVNFYANQYGEMNTAVNGVVLSGDAHASATPSSVNRYYFHQTNQSIFTAVSRKDGQTIDWDEEEYGVLWDADTYDLEWMTYAQYQQYQSDLAAGTDHQVYTYVSFYRPLDAASVNGSTGEKVTYLVYTNWSLLQNDIAFYDSVNKVYINYDAQSKTISTGSEGVFIDLETLPDGVSMDSIITAYVNNVKTYAGENAQTVTKANIYAVLGVDSWRIPRLNNMITQKAENKTGTAVNVYAPQRNTEEGVHVGSMLIWLGNNGKLTVSPTQGISLTKVVTEAVDGAPASFPFTVTVSHTAAFEQSDISVMDGYGQILSGWTVSEVTQSGGTYSCTVTGTLTDGAHAYILGLPAGAAYTVAEGADEYYNASISPASGTVADNTITAVVATNAPKEYGNLFITKEIVHGQAGQTVPDGVLERDFTLTVNFGTALAGKSYTVVRSGNEPTSVTVEADGTNAFTIRHGQTIEIYGLPKDAQVTVTESESANFTASYRSRNHSGEAADNNGTVTIPGNANATVVVTNTYTPTPVSVDLDVTITKELTGGWNGDGTFYFEVQHWNGSAWETVTEASITYDDGVATTNPVAAKVLNGVSFDRAGEYAYQVVEVQKDVINEITYDQTLYTFTVKVTDDNGRLTATVESANFGSMISSSDGSWQVSPTFTNSYHTAAVTIDVQKVITDEKGVVRTDKSLSGFAFALFNSNSSWETLGQFGVREFTDAAGEARFTWVVNANDKDTHYYILKELGTDGNGWTYDKSEYRVTVEVVENDDGTITATTAITDSQGNPVTGAEVPFTNIYDPADVEVELDVHKALNGRALTNGEFTFQVFEDTDPDSISDQEFDDIKLILTGTNDAEGKVTFDGKLTFSRVGVYYFNVRELKGGTTVGGMTYDGTVYDLVVEVTDHNGTLVANWYYEDDTDQTIVFTNTYVASGSVTLEAHKELDGRALSGGEFTFTLSGGNLTQPLTAGNLSDGSVTFPAIAYTQADIGKTYTYTITENIPADAVNNGKNGVTYTTVQHTVTVTVSDNGDGTLTATAAYPAGGAKFLNTYTTQDLDLTISGTKSLSGRDLENGEFTFILSGGNLAQALEAVNTGSSFVFPRLTYKQSDIGKTYTYTITEETGEAGGVRYDGSTYYAAVTVSDNGDGTMSTHTVYTDAQGSLIDADDVAFANSYHTENAVVDIYGTKVLEGHTMEAGEFLFSLYRAEVDAAGAPVLDADGNYTISGEAIRTVSNDEHGAFAFEDGSFTRAGTYYFVITEDVPADAVLDAQSGKYVYKGVSYDPAVYNVKITVTDDRNGRLIATSTAYVDGGAARALVESSIHFVNRYSTTPATLVLDVAGVKTFDLGTYTLASDAVFTFVVQQYKDGDGDGDFEWVTIQNKSDSVSFRAGAVGAPTAAIEIRDVLSGISFDTEGEYSFQIIEVVTDPIDSVTYDTSTHTINVVIADNGEGELVVDSVTDHHGHTITAGADGAYTVVPYFTNSYHTASAVIDVVKQVQTQSGSTRMNPADFEFALFHSNSSWEILSQLGESEFSDVAGEARFDTGLVYDTAGTYYYVLKELPGTSDLWTYDSAQYNITVVVTEVDGELEAKTTIVKAGTTQAVDVATFTNQYDPKDAQLELNFVKKVLYGTKMHAGDFTFRLTGSGVDYTGTNDAQGNVIFTENGQEVVLTFDKVGTYTYTVSEVEGSRGGMVYDDRTYEVTVTVIDDHGQLRADYSVAPNAGTMIVFENSYGVSSAQVTITANKTISGKRLTAGEFTFGLYHATVDAQGNVSIGELMEEAVNTKDSDYAGKAAFSRIQYTSLLSVGTHYYAVKEQIPSGADGDNTLNGVTYDDTVYLVTVTVTDDGSGSLDVTGPVYSVVGKTGTVDQISFTNIHTPDPIPVAITGSKVLMKDGVQVELGDRQFSFAVYQTGSDYAVAANAQPVATVKNIGGGISFHSFTAREAGRHYFVIRELASTYEDITADAAEFRVCITVTNDYGTLKAAQTVLKDGEAADSITFVNEYVPESADPGKTGDPIRLGLWAAMAAISGGALLVFGRKRKEETEG